MNWLNIFWVIAVFKTFRFSEFRIKNCEPELQTFTLLSERVAMAITAIQYTTAITPMSITPAIPTQIEKHHMKSGQ